MSPSNQFTYSGPGIQRRLQFQISKVVLACYIGSGSSTDSTFNHWTVYFILKDRTSISLNISPFSSTNRRINIRIEHVPYHALSRNNKTYVYFSGMPLGNQWVKPSMAMIIRMIEDNNLDRFVFDEKGMAGRQWFWWLFHHLDKNGFMKSKSKQWAIDSMSWVYYGKDRKVKSGCHSVLGSWKNKSAATTLAQTMNVRRPPPPPPPPPIIPIASRPQISSRPPAPKALSREPPPAPPSKQPTQSRVKMGPSFEPSSSTPFKASSSGTPIALPIPSPVPAKVRRPPPPPPTTRPPLQSRVKMGPSFTHTNYIPSKSPITSSSVSDSSSLKPKRPKLFVNTKDLPES